MAVKIKRSTIRLQDGDRKRRKAILKIRENEARELQQAAVNAALAQPPAALVQPPAAP